MASKPAIIWHYTTKEKLTAILSDGKLKVSEAEKRLKLRKPALWFSANQVWEPTATKMIGDGLGNTRQLTIQEQHEMVGLARIGINYSSGYITWAKYRHESGLNHSTLDSMEKVGIEKGGNPADWFATFKNVPEEKWVSVQVWNGTDWAEVEDEIE